ncbi:alcohol dehydrogenase GroES-like domain protein [Mycobacterium xenopi 3993]|nr:alcohol dehydrogenase GroES-like domain protein [Mycobacterium xenopi 3993]
MSAGLVGRGISARSTACRRSISRDGCRWVVPFRRPHPQGRPVGPNEVLRSLGLPTMFPTIGGHEGSGIVREVGDGVTDFMPGDHVVMSFVAVCGQCRWCASGMEYICDAGIGTLTPGMPTDGTFRHHTTDGKPLGHLSKIGAFAEHTVVSANSLVKIEPDLPLLPSALLSCAIPTGYGSAANRAGVRGGDTVVVVGAGASAPAQSRARGSTVPRRSLRSTRWSSNRSRRVNSAPLTPWPQPPTHSIWCVG